MIREVFCMAVALWAVMWAWDARAVPCWEEGNPSTHPLFHQEYSKQGSDALRIAIVRDHRHRIDTRYYIEALQEALLEAGVETEVEVACESTWDHIPYGARAAFYYVSGNFSQKLAERNQADLVAVLSYGTDGYCGLANLGTKDRAYIRTSASSCGTNTFVHEIGHNLGIHHAHASGYEGRKGWCMRPEDGARDCDEGTVMSYAPHGRRYIRFADVANGWGTEDHTAAAYLRESTPAQAMAWEIRTGFVGPDPMGLAETVSCPVASQRGTEWPSPRARRSRRVPTTPVHSH